jgi:tetratricopeptide (TPR) repeat protein
MRKISQILSTIFIMASMTAYAQGEKILEKGYEKYLDDDFQGAIMDFTKALSFNDQNAEAYYLRGVCKSSLGQKKEAMEDLDKATTLQNDYPEAYYEKGYIYLIDKNAELAIKEFDEVIKYNPEFAEAYVSRGTANCMLEKKSLAAADWAMAKKLGVDYSDYMVCD